jgi:hypothetical protein
MMRLAIAAEAIINPAELHQAIVLHPHPLPGHAGALIKIRSLFRLPGPLRSGLIEPRLWRRSLPQQLISSLQCRSGRHIAPTGSTMERRGVGELGLMQGPRHRLPWLPA